MGRILRGDVVWADLNPTVGHEQSSLRPVLVLSRDVFNQKSKTSIVVPLTSKPQKVGFPLTYQPTQQIGKKSVWVKILQIRTISTLRIGKKIDHLNARELERVIEGLNEIIG